MADPNRRCIDCPLIFVSEITSNKYIKANKARYNKNLFLKSISSQYYQNWKLNRKKFLNTQRK